MRGTGHLLIALVALLLPGILSAQIVPDTSRYDLLMPYIGAGYARISSGNELDAALRGSRAATLNGHDAFNSVVAGVSYLWQIEHRHFGVGIEYSATDMRAHDEAPMNTELTLRNLDFFFTVPFSLSSRWSGASASATTLAMPPSVRSRDRAEKAALSTVLLHSLPVRHEISMLAMWA